MKTIFFALLLISALSGTAQTGNVLQPALDSYLSLKDALTQDDPSAAQAGAQKLLTAIGQIQTSGFNDSQQKVWIKYAGKIKTGAGLIQKAGGLAEQRKYFIQLSKYMYEVVKAFQTNTTDVYYQFCPMANEGRGAYWLSTEAKIVNPYYGASMLHCGSVKDTLKGK